jgi:hypothetical protein
MDYHGNNHVLFNKHLIDQNRLKAAERKIRTPYIILKYATMYEKIP